MFKKTSTLILIIYIFIAATSAIAGTTYKINRLGQFNYFNQPALLGKGGSGLSVLDPHTINTINPAGIISAPVTKFEAEFIHESTGIKSDNTEGLSHYTNVNGVRLAVPLIVNKMVISLGLRPLTYNELQASETTRLSTGNKYTRELDDDGSLNQVSFGMAMSFKERFIVGVNANFNFGKTEEIWKVIFVSDLFRDTEDRIVSKMWGGSFSAGIITKLSSAWNVGAVYTSAMPLKMNNNIEYTFGESSETVHSDITIPHMFSIGSSYTIKEKTRFSVDYLYHPISEIEIDDEVVGGYEDTHSLSMGMELLPSRGYLVPLYSKLTYRIGFNYSKLGYIDSEGNDVTQYMGTLGIGLPYFGGFGRVDVAMGLGKRGNLSNNSIEETIYKITLSVSGGEKWFVRPK